jgi:hypothetical protein
MDFQFYLFRGIFCFIALLSGCFACSEEPKSDLIQITVPKKFDEDIYLVDIANYLIAEYSIEWEKKMFLYDKRTSKGYNLNGGVLDEDGEPLILYPLDLTKDIFYFVKSVEYQDATIEEANPLIGIVRLK